MSTLNPLSALALTAGLGTRLRPYTESRAKPSLPFLGVPLAHHALRHLENLPVTQLFLNLHHSPQSIRDLDFSNLCLPSPKFSDESAMILGGGGALHLLIDQIQNQQILLLNGDEVLLPWDQSALSQVYEEHVTSGRLATIVTMAHPEVGQSLGGIWTKNDNRMICVSKSEQPGLVGHHFTGYMFLRKEIQKYFKAELREENILYETLTLAIQNHEEVLCTPIGAHWYETGLLPLFLDSTRSVLDLCEGSPEQIPVKAFLAFLKRFKNYELLIEQQDPLLAARLEHFWRSLTAL